MDWLLDINLSIFLYLYSSSENLQNLETIENLDGLGFHLNLTRTTGLTIGHGAEFVLSVCASTYGERRAIPLERRSGGFYYLCHGSQRPGHERKCCQFRFALCRPIELLQARLRSGLLDSLVESHLSLPHRPPEVRLWYPSPVIKEMCRDLAVLSWIP